MMFKVKCRCGKTIRAGLDRLGTKLVCDDCGYQILLAGREVGAPQDLTPGVKLSNDAAEAEKEACSRNWIFGNRWIQLGIIASLPLVVLVALLLLIEWRASKAVPAWLPEPGKLYNGDQVVAFTDRFLRVTLGADRYVMMFDCKVSESDSVGPDEQLVFAVGKIYYRKGTNSLAQDQYVITSFEFMGKYGFYAEELIPIMLVVGNQVVFQVPDIDKMPSVARE